MNTTATPASTARELLVGAAEQFRFYERQHRAKSGGDDPTSDTHAKAEVNRARAEQIEQFLNTTPESASGDLTRLGRALADVREFHEVFAPDWLPLGVPIPLTFTEATTRAKWIRSEANELEHDTGIAPPFTMGSDEMFDLIAKQADAFLDAIYFALGGLVRMGLDADALWAIVHGQNMAKRQPDGTVKRRESDGKVVKPEGWVDPHQLLVAEIKRQADAA